MPSDLKNPEKDFEQVLQEAHAAVPSDELGQVLMDSQLEQLQ